MFFKNYGGHEEKEGILDLNNYFYFAALLAGDGSVIEGSGSSGGDGVFNLTIWPRVSSVLL